jgi:hypothetical protein
VPVERRRQQDAVSRALTPIFDHFTGRSEKWLLSRLPDDSYWWRNNKNSNNSSGRSTKTTAAGYWYRELDRLNQELRFGLDMDDSSNRRGKVVSHFPVCFRCT